MKKVLTSVVLAAVITAFLSSCSEENIRPRDQQTGDKCQFSGKNCN